MWSGICVHVEVRGQRLGSHFPSLSKGGSQADQPTGFQSVSCFSSPFSIVGCWDYRCSHFQVQLLCGFLESGLRFTGLDGKHFPEPRNDSSDSAEAV